MCRLYIQKLTQIIPYFVFVYAGNLCIINLLNGYLERDILNDKKKYVCRELVRFVAEILEQKISL